MRKGASDWTIVVSKIRESGKERRVQVIWSEVFDNNHCEVEGLEKKDDKIITGK